MKNLIWILTAMVLLLTACNDNAEVGNMSYTWEDGGNDSYKTTEAEPGTYTLASKDANSETTEEQMNNSGDVPSTSLPPKKSPDKIIKTGNLGMEVNDYAKSLEKIRSAVKQAQGYISSENEQRNNYRVSNTITIRVGSDNFDMLIEGLAGEADVLKYKNIDLLDVTEEYTDLSSRLKTKKEVEERYLDILKTAKTVKDILAVEEELRQVREEIEVVEGRLKYLSDRVAYSTISLNITQEFDYIAPTPNQVGFGTRILNGLIGGWNGLQGFVVGLAYTWPFLLMIGLFILLIRLWWKKRQARKAMYA